jgi:MarR family transcriptional regulator, transcriptional regulator for hemolysin
VTAKHAPSTASALPPDGEIDGSRGAGPPADPSYARDLRLSYLIHDVSRLRRLTFDQLMKPLGATRAQWWVIAFLSRRDGIRQTDLAFELDIGKASLGALIERLESGGWVERRADPVDRRAKRVYLSAKSRRFAREMQRVDRAFNAEMLAQVTEAERDTMVRLLSILKHALQRLTGKSLRAPRKRRR